MPQNIQRDELYRLLACEKAVCLLDVRTGEEYVRLGHLPGAVLIPIDELPQRLHELDPARKTVVICQHGIRSEAAARYLAHFGFASVYHYEPGMADWDGPVVYDPVVSDPQNPCSLPESVERKASHE